MKCSISLIISIILLYLTSCVPPASKHIDDISMQNENKEDDINYMLVPGERNSDIQELPSESKYTATDKARPKSEEEEEYSFSKEEMPARQTNPVLPSIDYKPADMDDHTERKENIRNKFPDKTNSDALRPLKQEIYSHVNEMPRFPGGDEQLKKWLQANLQYPSAATNNQQQGKVTVRFVVYPDGSIGEVQIKKGVNSVLNKEALRVVSMMPNWVPGKLDDTPVPVWCALPIVFKLQEYPY